MPERARTDLLPPASPQRPRRELNLQMLSSVVPFQAHVPIFRCDARIALKQARFFAAAHLGSIAGAAASVCAALAIEGGMRRTTTTSPELSSFILLRIEFGMDTTFHSPPSRNWFVNTLSVWSRGFLSLRTKVPAA